MIIRHDRSDKESIVDVNDWPGITNFFRGRGVATLIAPNWLLTAAHVARHIPTNIQLSVELAGKRYPIARTILYPNYKPAWEQNEGYAGIVDLAAVHDTIDLAVVQLTTPVEDVAPFKLYDQFDELGKELILLGWGECGNGLHGARGADHTLRRATNQIHEVDDYWIKYRFEAPPEGTVLEGVSAGGDSGGPALLWHDGQFKIAGVSSWQDHGDKPLGTYGCIEHYARVSMFVDWIRETCGL
jgi:Trypsin